MSKNSEDVLNLNIHQKLLKIADMAGVLQKNKAGYNYKYTTEDEIQAKITAGMQKYGVMLYPSLIPGSLKIEPYHYEKVKVKNGNETTTPVHEIIVSAEVAYTWVNVSKPEEKIECTWAYIGQMEDASQAFGAGATYGNRYYLLKALQLATTDDDPDNYRSKQKKAEQYEEELKIKEEKQLLKKEITEISDLGTELIQKGTPKEKIIEIVASLNNGNGNPNSIKSLEICAQIKEELKKVK